MNHRPKSLRRVLTAAIATIAATSAVALTTGAAHAYPPQPPGEESLAVSTLEPNCELDVPYIEWALEPIGFETAGPTTITVRDLDGNVVVPATEFPGLSGKFIYPGASADADGNGTAWPDERLRSGVDVTFEVNPTVTATVGYVEAGAPCFGPANIQAVSSAGAGSLPATGNSGVSSTVVAAAAALALGLALTSWSVLANRRRDPATTD